MEEQVKNSFTEMKVRGRKTYLAEEVDVYVGLIREQYQKVVSENSQLMSCLEKLQRENKEIEQLREDARKEAENLICTTQKITDAYVSQIQTEMNRRLQKAESEANRMTEEAREKVREIIEEGKRAYIEIKNQSD